MKKETLYQLIEKPSLCDASTREELKTVVEMFPYFHSARLLYTKNLYLSEEENYEEELSRTAIFCADRKKLFYLIQEDRYLKFLSKTEHQDTTQTDRTQALLDSFLTTLEETTPQAQDEATGPGVSIVSIDYFSYLESLGIETEKDENEVHLLKHQEIIDSFIQKAASDEIFTPPLTQEEKPRYTPDNELDKEDFLTETLARIYIKQKKYEQALTIIKRLSLNFPKKSVYFADQIRFLEYLIINEKNKK